MNFIQNDIIKKYEIIDGQELILGDCLEVLKTFEPNSIDTIITSPPYNLGIKYNTYNDKIESEKYLTLIENVFTECKRVLTDTGSIFLNIGGTNVDPFVPYNVIFRLKEFLVLQNNIIWIKSISIDKDSYGHYQPINSLRFLNNMYEHIFHLTKNGKVTINRKAIGVPFKYKCNMEAKTVTEDIRCRGNTWFIPYETIQTKSQRGDHPATFPKKLVEWCIKLSNGKTILDPFLGTGTTLMVSRDLNCKGIGIEIDEKYFLFAKDKLSKVDGILKC